MKSFFLALFVVASIANARRFRASVSSVLSADLDIGVSSPHRRPPSVCADPTRGSGAEDSPPFYPLVNPKVDPIGHLFKAGSNLPDPTCTQSLSGKANWALCPSRSRNFEKCSWYCPSTRRTHQTFPTDHEKNCPPAVPEVCMDEGRGHEDDQRALPRKKRNLWQKVTGGQPGVVASCATSSKDPDNWVKCPSRSNDYQSCSWYCPASGETKAHNLVKKGDKTCPEIPAHTAPIECGTADDFDGVEPILDLPNHASCTVQPQQLSKGWIACPSRTTANTCSHFCPSTGITVAPSASATTACNPVPRSIPNTWVVSHATDVCVQIDIKLLGVTELNFAVSGTISLEAATGGYPTLTAAISIGGGFTVGAVFVKASLYVEGTASISAQLPKHIRNWRSGMAWVLRKWYEENKRTSSFGKMIRKFSDIEYPVDGQATKKNIKKILAISEEVHKDVKVGHDQHGERTAEEEAIIVSGKRVFFHLIKEYRQQAQAGLNAIAAAVTGKKSAEKKQELQSHAYLHWFSNVWRKVYMNLVNPSELSTSMFTRSPACDIKTLRDELHKTHPNKHVESIQPLMCTFFKFGYLLPGKDYGRKGNSNGNMMKMFPIVYPELFPSGSALEDMTTESADPLNMRFDMDEIHTILTMASQRFSTAGGTRQWARMCLPHKQGHADVCLDAKSFTARGLVSILALTPIHLQAALQAYNQIHTADECESGASCEEACGIKSIALSGTVGLTVGSSSVGFCSPDTNPFQVTVGGSFEWTRDEHNCRLSSRPIFTGVTTQFTFAVGHYLAVDIAWTDQWKPTQFRLRIRAPTEGVEIQEGSGFTTDGTAGWFQQLIDRIGADAGADAGSMSAANEAGMKNWMSTTFSGFWEKLVAAGNAVTGDGAKIMAPFAGTFNQRGSGGLAAKILNGIKRADVGVGLPSITNQKLYGFDIFYDRTKETVSEGLEFSIVYTRLSGASGDVPIGGPFTAGVQTYSNSETRLTLKNPSLPGWLKRLLGRR